MTSADSVRSKNKMNVQQHVSLFAPQNIQAFGRTAELLADGPHRRIVQVKLRCLSWKMKQINRTLQPVEKFADLDTAPNFTGRCTLSNNRQFSSLGVE